MLKQLLSFNAAVLDKPTLQRQIALEVKRTVRFRFLSMKKRLDCGGTWSPRRFRLKRKAEAALQVTASRAWVSNVRKVVIKRFSRSTGLLSERLEELRRLREGHRASTLIRQVPGPTLTPQCFILSSDRVRQRVQRHKCVHAHLLALKLSHDLLHLYQPLQTSQNQLKRYQK